MNSRTRQIIDESNAALRASVNHATVNTPDQARDYVLTMAQAKAHNYIHSAAFAKVAADAAKYPDAVADIASLRAERARNIEALESILALARDIKRNHAADIIAVKAIDALNAAGIDTTPRR